MSEKIDHKIVCWGDYAIPVPLRVNWMAMDKIGRWYAYADEPETAGNAWAASSGLYMMLDDEVKVDAPEPGHWTEQLYLIG
ncbi:MAG: hypothetical protein WBM71_07405 [Sedimenticolaceae bacterium]